jgi:methylenetetrahydrofolate reductase (NADPH)
MNFRDKLRAGQFVMTAEVAPPKGISLEKVILEIAAFRGRVDAINVTDLQSSVMRMSALAAARLIQAAGFETILQVTCRDRNRLALQSDVLSAAALGLHNILALTGDHPAQGDHPQSKPVFDLDAVQLIEAVRKLEQGMDLSGHKLIGPLPRYCVGGVVNPGADPLEPELIKMEKKIEAGAEFFQTQAIFDPAVFENFLKAAGPLKARIIAGVVVLRSERMARHMNEHVPGVHVPEGLIAELNASSERQARKAASVAIAARLIKSLKPMCQGIHIMPIGWYGVMPELLDSIS